MASSTSRTAKNFVDWKNCGVSALQVKNRNQRDLLQRKPVLNKIMVTAKSY